MGIIIGPGGCRITKIRNESKAIITVANGVLGSNEKIITIKGSEKKIVAAMAMLHVTAKQSNPTFATYLERGVSSDSSDKKRKEKKKSTMKDAILCQQKLARKKQELEEAKLIKNLEQKEERERKIFRKRGEEKLLQEKIRSENKREIKTTFQNIRKEASTCLINKTPPLEGFLYILEVD